MRNIVLFYATFSVFCAPAFAENGFDFDIPKQANKAATRPRVASPTVQTLATAKRVAPMEAMPALPIAAEVTKSAEQPSTVATLAPLVTNGDVSIAKESLQAAEPSRVNVAPKETYRIEPVTKRSHRAKKQARCAR